LHWGSDAVSDRRGGDPLVRRDSGRIPGRVRGPCSAEFAAPSGRRGSTERRAASGRRHRIGRIPPMGCGAAGTAHADNRGKTISHRRERRGRGGCRVGTAHADRRLRLRRGRAIAQHRRVGTTHADRRSYLRRGRAIGQHRRVGTAHADRRLHLRRGRAIGQHRRVGTAHAQRRLHLPRGRAIAQHRRAGIAHADGVHRPTDKRLRAFTHFPGGTGGATPIRVGRAHPTQTIERCCPRPPRWELRFDAVTRGPCPPYAICRGVLPLNTHSCPATTRTRS
jgi:hypothetical protein